jgi:transposase-like protein
MERAFQRKSSMSELEHKWGYCPCCLKNSPHFCAPMSRLTRALEILSFGHAKNLRLGPWYCVHCETKSIYLREERPDAPRFRSDDEEADDDANSTDLTSSSVTQPVGNFLKSEQSLVMRSARLKRFSEKYRDSIVRRLLSGTSTMAQIRQEKDITEGELTGWIADLFERMQARLDTLEETLETNPDVRLLSEHPNMPRAASIPAGPTVEGHIKPR